MLTPKFWLEQTPTEVIIHIIAPYTNVKKTEIHVLDEDVRFYSAPYYLRLNLPGKVVETANSSAKYNADDQSFVITLDKVIPGEVFPNLEMLTSLLQPKRDTPSSSKPLIEVLSSEGPSEDNYENIEDDDWFVDQKLEAETPSQDLLHQYRYGFANKHFGLGEKYEVELAEVAEIKNPDALSPAQRQVGQEEAEQRRFTDDHYLEDLMVTDLSAVLSFNLNLKSYKKLSDSNRTQLKNLANREFLLDKVEQKRVYLGLVDILFAYLHDLRINEGSHCVESVWNISRVSASLSWFQTFDNANTLIRSCVRRALCYPLYRNWNLVLRTLKDTLDILAAGNVTVLKCFLGIFALFKSKEPYYLLNQLYIEEYCVWIQQMSVETLNQMTQALSRAIEDVRKEDMGLDLVELEVAARVTEEEEMEAEMSYDISQIKL